MKPRLNPTEIVLKDLPPEGREFIFTRESEELTDFLKDLIGANPYTFKFKLTPMGNTFDLKGHLSTELDLQCSMCALDFKHSVEQDVHELIVIDRPLAKGDQMTRNNHAHEWESAGPDCILLESDVFKVGEYAHEQIGLAEPIRPLGKPNCDVDCENLSQKVQRPWLSYGGDDAGPVKTNPFQVLEKMKLKS